MFDVGPSPFDVRLVAFRIPIRVHWSFWLATMLLGWNPDHFELVFIWVICAFFSILVHELGHALTAEFYGWPSEIVLYFGGGVAISDRHRNHTAGRSLVVSFMGPGAGFLLYLLVYGLVIIVSVNRIPLNEYMAIAVLNLLYINLWWGLFNLIPVMPLDGGHICFYLCQMLGLRDPYGVATKIGIAASGAAAYLLFTRYHASFAGSFMLMFCIQGFYSLQTPRR